MARVRIHITGVVQGVGFRPFVYREAVTRGLTGWVLNASDGVHVEAKGPLAALRDFAQALRADAPAAARIDAVEAAWESDEQDDADSAANGDDAADGTAAVGADNQKTAGQEPNGAAENANDAGAHTTAAPAPRFEIRASEADAARTTLVSPDIATCPDCLRELFDPANRRYHYPFINCTNCGPRFTIIRDLPYDRPATSMAAFPMCPDCAAEYADPADRRFHAQPDACFACGPHFFWRERPGLEHAGKGAAHGNAQRSEPASAGAARLSARWEDEPREHLAVSAGFAASKHRGTEQAAKQTGRTNAPGQQEPAPNPAAAPFASALHSAAGRELVARAAHEAVCGRTRAESDTLIARCAELLASGGIVAVKGLGGFHLACNAADDDAVRELRRRKRRSNKPLAVMVPALADAEALCRVNDAERALLTGSARPIVLLRRRAADCGARTPTAPSAASGAPGDACGTVLLAPAVAFDLPELGVMLPYTPLQHLLLAACAEVGVRALVMTSGNLSEEPIETDDALAWEHLVASGIADALLGNDRAILSRYDDSVVRVAAGGVMPVRRARGYAPQPLELPAAMPPAAALSAAMPPASVLSAFGQPCAQGPSRGQTRTPSAQSCNALQNPGQGRGKPQLLVRSNEGDAAETGRKAACGGAQGAEAPARAGSGTRDTETLAQAGGNARKTETPTGPTSALPGVLACGSEQKATLAYTRERADGTAQCFLSQHIGDVENAGTMDAWHEARTRFARLFGLRADALACDAHPRYFSSQWARAEAKRSGVPLVEVQHHHAHVAAVIAEAAAAGRIAAGEKVVGLAFDGTGAGAKYEDGHLVPDGTIWGGEILVAGLADFTRAAHLRPWRLPGGAASVRDARRNAFALLDSCGLLDDPAAREFLSTLEPETRSITATMLARNLNCPVTTSMGRLFDAVAALLGICPQATYEGEPAVALEAAAWRAVGAENPSETLARAAAVVFRGEELARFAGGTMTETAENHLTGSRPAVISTPCTGPSEASSEPPLTLDQVPVVRAVLAAHAGGVSAELCALAFHEAVAQAACAAARSVGARYGLRAAALSGGVFMNRLLLERVTALLKQAGFTVLVPRAVPVNDGCIAYGQAAVARARLSCGAERHPFQP